MNLSKPKRTVYRTAWLLILIVSTCAVRGETAETIVPGTGSRLSQVGDDFEGTDWRYLDRPPKSTRDLDGDQRFPSGESANRKWYEGMKRGAPDIVRRIETPVGGLPGSRGALLLRSLDTGIPGRPSFQMQQDDFIADVNYRLGGAIPVSRGPNVVVRVFLPPVDSWENRTGPHFGFRASLETTITNRSRTLRFSSQQAQTETYWAGMFIEFQSQTDGHDNDYASLRLRGDESGNDVTARQITTTGWWTLGYSVTPDGVVHYYASPGVDDLTEDDRIASMRPYGYRAESFKTFFFNVCSGDDGRNWSTPWVIDDPMVYVAY